MAELIAHHAPCPFCGVTIRIGVEIRNPLVFDVQNTCYHFRNVVMNSPFDLEATFASGKELDRRVKFFIPYDLANKQTPRFIENV